MVFHFSCLIVSICNQQFLFISCFFVINNSVFFCIQRDKEGKRVGSKGTNASNNPQIMAQAASFLAQV